MFGTKRKAAKTQEERLPKAADNLAMVTVSGAEAVTCDYGRRAHSFGFRRLVVPSLILDYTFLFLRQSGALGHEKYLAWAGTLAANEAFVSTIILPRADAAPMHGEVEAGVVGRVLEALDRRDLVPVAQVHTHPAEAFISGIDRKRPMVSIHGFWSIIIPHFGFTPASNSKEWGVYEYLGRQDWHELDQQEKSERLIIDDSLLRID
jgi:hypothetical protein